MDLPFLEALAEEEARFKKFSMAGTNDVLVAGNIKAGFTVNILKEGGDEGSGGGTPVTGACCFCDGTCSEETFGQCLDDGGTFQGGGTLCDPNPCDATGACCDEDGGCTVTTEADCSGTYMGDCSECDPNPCPTTATGACCTDTTCSVGSPESCVGTYLGDGTDCGPPNPCGGGGTICDPGFIACGSFCCPDTEQCCWSEGRDVGCCPIGFSCNRGTIINHCCEDGTQDFCPDGSCCSTEGDVICCGPHPDTGEYHCCEADLCIDGVCF